VDVVNITTGAISTTAAPGQTVSLYAVGLGATEIGPYGLQWDTVMPSISVSGLAAQVLFAGLNPSFAGLYQINITVPNGVPGGSQPLSIQMGTSAPENVNITIGQGQ